ncbi:hypothetical protein E2C01_045024 [Portunus trituberculatus]|uniref:Uncharacterized protein n=1 Tax=Portunus trituberculatus TaxID=210409 RepID=A0A5B7G1Q5_PORTR|nr:hypothetical protein [Portunus trituberculatus]
MRGITRGGACKPPLQKRTVIVKSGGECVEEQRGVKVFHYRHSSGQWSPPVSPAARVSAVAASGGLRKERAGRE